MPQHSYISRQDLWNHQYRARRYLEHLSEYELIQRTKDTLANHVILSDDLKIGLHAIHDEGEYWMIMFSDICEEFVLRGYKYPEPLAGQLADVQAPKYDWNGLSSAVKAISEKSLVSGEFLIKFGEYQYLQPMLEVGETRIMPASFYKNSPNPAIRDSELEIKLSALPTEVTMEVIDAKTGTSKRQISPIGNIEFTLSTKSDYYLFCLAGSYAHRMFGDFKADACLIIKNPKRFLDRITEQFKFQLPDLNASGRAVDYVDPLNSNGVAANAYFSKHFRYSYQKEFRVVWIPENPSFDLKPVFLNLGDLRDYCEIMRLHSD